MVTGVGLGLRRDILDYFLNTDQQIAKFVELAPENWMGLGGKFKKNLKAISERYPITTHGLSLSIGSPEPLDWEFIGRIKEFIKEYNVQIYSEHLSYSKCDNAHLYDLLPIPFCKEAVDHVSQRIREVQDFLERKLAIEIVSYYTPVAPEMKEIEFVNQIVEKADCNLLLDVNNIYVNAFNHKYNAKDFIDNLPLEKVAYIHMAGHEKKSDDLIIDTHGQPIIDPVFDLFEWTVQKIKPVPVLLERDFNFPEREELQGEIDRLQGIVDEKWGMLDAA